MITIKLPLSSRNAGGITTAGQLSSQVVTNPTSPIPMPRSAVPNIQVRSCDCALARPLASHTKPIATLARTRKHAAYNTATARSTTRANARGRGASSTIRSEYGPLKPARRSTATSSRRLIGFQDGISRPCGLESSRSRAPARPTPGRRARGPTLRRPLGGLYDIPRGCHRWLSRREARAPRHRTSRPRTRYSVRAPTSPTWVFSAKKLSPVLI